MMGPVVLLTTNLARGGAEAQVALLAQSLTRRGWDVTLVSLLEPSAFQAELSAAGIPVHSLGMQPGRPNPWALVRLAKILRELRPRVLHSHMFHANLMARLMRLVFPIPLVISTLHSMAESSRHSAGTRVRDWAYRITEPLAGVTVAVCQAVAERHAAAGAVRRASLRVIPNGVDTVRFRPSAEHRVEPDANAAFVWLAVGRLMWKKDYPTLLRAAARLRTGTLRIVGEGPLDAELKSLAHELGAPVRFLGPRDDVASLMNAAGAVVLSSVVEGLPMVLLEAAASGLPCVTTDAGGARDAVLDGQTGFVTPGNDPEALAAAMQRLMDLPVAERAAMGLRARELALSRFDVEQVTSQWERLYRECEAPIEAPTVREPTEGAPPANEPEAPTVREPAEGAPPPNRPEAPTVREPAEGTRPPTEPEAPTVREPTEGAPPANEPKAPIRAATVREPAPTPTPAAMDVTNRFVLDFAMRFAARRTGARVLDFGCGAGRLVQAGLAAGLDIAGADVYYGGSQTRAEAAHSGLLGNAIREIRDGRLDYPAATFDLVVNNQVLEHVDDLDRTLSEIHRVLKPGGTVLSVFPSRDVFREGHIGIPFAHWFPRDSRPRFYYTWALRRIGLGTWKQQAPTCRQWAVDKLAWIDTYTRYRTRREIFAAFEPYFVSELRESDYIRYRLLDRPGRQALARLADLPVASAAARALFRKLAFLVILSRKVAR